MAAANEFELKPLLAFVIAFALLAGLAPEPATSVVAAPAHAQQKRNFQGLNLLDMIFGGALRKQRVKRSRSQTRARRVIVTPGSSGVIAGSASAPKEVVEKVDNAAKVLVVGDFMADGLGWGLEQAYADSPNLVFVSKGEGLSGLVRDDVRDWPATVPQLIAEHRPVAVIVLVGMNDRQQMRLAGGRAEKLDDAWKAEYQKRIESIVRSVRGAGLPLFWVGLPPVNSSSMNRDYLVFNEFYRNAVEAAGGKFIDVWDGFTNAEGQFVAAGPDVNGQIVRLRNSDGINMTRAGKSKLAFYAERELRRLPGLASGSAVAALPGLDAPTEPLAPQYDPAASGRTIVIALDGPMADGGDLLEGGEEEAQAEDEDATSYDLVVNGVAALPRKGRIDYVWGAPGGKRTERTEDPEKNASLSEPSPEHVSSVPLPNEPRPGEADALSPADTDVTDDQPADEPQVAEEAPAERPVVRQRTSTRQRRVTNEIPVNGVGSLSPFTNRPNH